MSIIVPVYNVERYVGDCLKSLVTQDLARDEYEIVCVDDGSTDGSLKIIQSYAEKYDNIKVIRKENGGVSSARNVGIKNSLGKYIWFVDSDDCVRSNCLGQVARELREKRPNFVILDFKRVDEEYIFGECNIDIICESTAIGSSYAVYSMIIDSDIIKRNDIRFDVQMKYGEDTLFCYFVGLYGKGKNNLQIKTPIYFYRQRASSAMNLKTVENITRHTEDLIHMAYVYKQILADGIEDSESRANTQERVYWAIEGALTILPQSSLNCRETLNQLKKDGLYPYPTLWSKFFQSKGIKGKLIQFPKLFFKYRLLYNIYYRIRRK